MPIAADVHKSSRVVETRIDRAARIERAVHAAAQVDQRHLRAAIGREDLVGVVARAKDVDVDILGRGDLSVVAAVLHDVPDRNRPLRIQQRRRAECIVRRVVDRVDVLEPIDAVGEAAGRGHAVRGVVVPKDRPRRRRGRS